MRKLLFLLLFLSTVTTVLFLIRIPRAQARKASYLHVEQVEEEKIKSRLRRGSSLLVSDSVVGFSCILAKDGQPVCFIATAD